jgi:hypothetical protein
MPRGLREGGRKSRRRRHDLAAPGEDRPLASGFRSGFFEVAICHLPDSFRIWDLLPAVHLGLHRLFAVDPPRAFDLFVGEQEVFLLQADQD